MSLAGLLETLTACLPSPLAPYTLWAAHRLGALEEVLLEGRRFHVTRLVRVEGGLPQSPASCRLTCGLSRGLPRSWARAATPLCTCARRRTASTAWRPGSPLR